MERPDRPRPVLRREFVVPPGDKKANENALALAFLAEILVDQQKWAQAEETIKQAIALQPESMDVQRVYGYVLESLGQYRLAIEKYREAVKIHPNLTFLYIFIGRNFRSLEVHNRALEEFEKAVMINEQLGVQDPVPYVEIAKTYSRDGEFFIAALNAEKAITINPYNPNTYGQLGIIYTKARNFEGAQPVLKCAVRGCTAEENQVAQELLGEGVSASLRTDPQAKMLGEELRGISVPIPESLLERSA